MAGLFILSVTSCAGNSGNAGSSDGLFGAIPQTLTDYEKKQASIKDGMDDSNYRNKEAESKELKEATKAKLEEQGQALNGKELAVSTDEEELKVDKALTLVFKNVFSNLKAVEFGLDGNVLAAKDLKLDLNPSDLKGRELLGGKTSVVTVKLPVHIEFLDAGGNIVDTRTIGSLVADNNGTESIVKAGTAIDFNGSVPVSAKFIDVASARLVIDLTKALTSETMP